MIVANPNWFTASSIASGLGALMVAVMCYFAGRMHQYFRQGVDRERAFAHGYNLASRSLFALAVRTTKALQGSSPRTPGLTSRELRRPSPGPIRASVAVGPRHAAAGKSTRQETKQHTAWDVYRKSA